MLNFLPVPPSQRGHTPPRHQEMDRDTGRTPHPAHPVTRHSAWLALAALLWLWPAVLLAFGYDDVVRRAAALAARPHEPPPQVPEFLRRLDYDAHRDIRFRPEHSLWRRPGTHFDVQLFHPGAVFDRPVRINVYDSTGVHPLPFHKDWFDYGRNADLAARIPDDLGYAGFKLYYPLNRPDVQDEVIAFAGASYFRAVSAGARYGLSARGLAIDTGLESGEEFPLFREFWLERPSPRAKAMVVYALLDGPRVTGAYRFVIHPGRTTRVDVRATLFQREAVQELGIAPLTSMFWYGEAHPRPAAEYRDEVHDSDGLFLVNGNGERLWRPLANERRLRLSQFRLENPRLFGLLQRDRDFASYQDLEARMELRPSAWVEPRGDWGGGYVKLTEIPTRNEFNDNIVAYWVMDPPPPAGRPVEIAYRIGWSLDEPLADAGSRVVGTRLADGHEEGTRRFLVDFAGPALAALDPEAEVQGVVSGDRKVEIVEQHVTHNPVTGGWRLSFALRPPRKRPLVLRAYLRHGDDVLSETWTWLMEPES